MKLNIGATLKVQSCFAIDQGSKTCISIPKPFFEMENKFQLIYTVKIVHVHAYKINVK